MRLSKWLLNFAIFLAIIVPAMSGCSFSKLPGVEVLVPDDEDAGRSMTLSPKGDKLIYHSRSVKTPIVLNLVTGAKQEIDSEHCGSQSWIDDQTIFCWGTSAFNIPPALVDSNDLSLTEVKEVRTTDINLTSLLAEADRVFALQAPFRHRSEDIRDILILSQNYLENPAKNYFVSDIENVEQILRGVPHNVIFSKSPLDEKVYSPNGEYYYVHTWEVSLAIYSSSDDKLLIEVPLGETTDRKKYQYKQAKIAGWTYDSGGVIYRGITPPLWQSPILIVEVPR